MASGNFIFPAKAQLNFLSTTNLLAANPANFRMALTGSGWTPNDNTNEVFADVGNEIAGGNGYTSGGIALTGVTLALNGSNKPKFTCNAAVWTASGSGIPAFRYCVIYYNGTLNGKTNPLVGYCIGDNAPADIPATTAGNTLTVTPSVNGILAVS